MNLALEPPTSLSPPNGNPISMAARRRSSAAAASRPALPPPTLPIPPLPDSPEIPRRIAQEELEDPPPPSILNNSLLAAPDTRPEPRIPSSRRALTRALELAREAVQLDSTNEEPEAAVIAYARSVALLSEVMERVRRGEDSTERRRNGRPRSAVAQEEEVRRLQNIHDTYADRMNILSIIYNIPPIPYSVTHEYSVMADEAAQRAVGFPITPMENNELFVFDNSGAGAHPYAAASSYDEPQQPGNPPRIRRPRAPSAAALGAPPRPPPPAAALPPAPGPPPDANLLEVKQQQTHRRTNSGSRLAALEEDTREEHVQPYGDSPPFPAAPSPTIASRQPGGLPRPPPSPRAGVVTIQPRPRGSSQVVQPRPEVAIAGYINGTTNSGTIHQRRKQSSTPASERSSSPAESTTSINSNPVPKPSGSTGRPRSVSQPGRRPSLVPGRISPTADPLPPLPDAVARKSSFPSKLSTNPNNLSIVTNPATLGVGAFAHNPTTPTSPLPPAPPTDPLRKPYHMMSLLRASMTSTSGGYLTRRLHVPYEVWSQGGAKLANIAEKIRVVDILYSALDDLQKSSSEHFGAGNVSSGLALGIGSIGRKEGEQWVGSLEEFSSVCDGVVANFGKKLGVGEGFVVKKTTLTGKLTNRFNKLTTGKNLDSPQTYVSGLVKLFESVQLLDEHSKAIIAQPVAPAYAALPPDIRAAADNKLKRASQFFATVVLTFVIRDLSLLLDKYAKKCEKWLAE
ncbi:hypothetical protein MKEN_00780900 [Mycena kentingensis (nom. inval.)]|nr:hypothetical protein MKEN_00780900 [Mycena kentingensis (nom. inval.)]